MEIKESVKNDEPKKAEPASVAPPRDPEIVPDFERIEDGRRLLSALGSPVDFWEALCLARMDASTARDEAPRDSLNPVVKGAIDQGLRHLRQELGSLARELRFFMERTAVGFDSAHSERVIGFILASETERAAALRWVTDPVHAQEAADRIAQISSRVEHCRRAAELPQSRDAELPQSSPGDSPSSDDVARAFDVEPSDREQDSSVGPSLNAEPPPQCPASRRGPGLHTVTFKELALPSNESPKPEVKAPDSAPHAGHADFGEFKDVRLARAWAELFRDGPGRVELWESVFLLATAGDAVRPQMEDLLRAKKSADSPAFREVAANLHQQILGIRWEWGWFVGRLRGYLEPMFRGRPSEEVFETALGLLVSCAGGRERAIRWLDQPDRFKAEAEALMKTMLDAAERSSSAVAASA
jgi:hypothetical protein